MPSQKELGPLRISAVENAPGSEDFNDPMPSCDYYTAVQASQHKVQLELAPDKLEESRSEIKHIVGGLQKKNKRTP